MTARDNILARVRKALGKSEVEAASDIERVQAHLRAHPLGPRPPFAWPDLVEQFKQASATMLSTVDEVETIADVPAAVSNYLRDNQLDQRAVCWPELGGLDWRAANVQMQARTIRDGDLVGITGAFCGIAETGTLMLLSGAQTPAATSLLPDTHIAIVRAARIVPGLEEAWNLMRHQSTTLDNQSNATQPPRAVNFVSGPSRSGDIEMQIVLGVHGPYRVHIIVVRQSDNTPRELINTDWWRTPSA